MSSSLYDLLESLDPESLGRQMHGWVERLLPLPRSITGQGVRDSLNALGELAPLELHEVPSGTQVFDWVVPNEWNVKEAWIADPSGQRIVDFADSSLHLLGYSVPFRGTLSRAELDEHLFSLPDQPELVPYRTSYYRETWGFCLPHRQREALPEGDYEVCIDAELAPGSLTYGELFLPGRSDEEILLSAHICHPALANDNLSGVITLAYLARTLADHDRRLGVRLLWAPGTIGAITWLARNEAAAGRIKHGLVAANLGDRGSFHYKRSRRGDAVIDRAVAHLLAQRDEPFAIEDFVPFGYDERQYCSPGFDLAVGSLTRTPWGRYPEYHTSADDLKLVSARSLGHSLLTYLEVVAALEADRTFRSLNPRCEPQLGRRGLYRSIGGDDRGRERELALLWVLNLADGEHSLLVTAERSGLSLAELTWAAEALVEADLLEEVLS